MKATFAEVLFLSFAVCTFAQSYKDPNDPNQPNNNDGSSSWAAYDRYKQVYENLRNQEQAANGGGQNIPPANSQHGHYASVDDKYYIDTYSNDNPNDPQNQYYQHGDHYHSQGQNQMGYPGYPRPVAGNPNQRRGNVNDRHYNTYGGTNRNQQPSGTDYGNTGGATSYAKPGYCPMVSEKLQGNCRRQCNSDKECPGYTICCINNCDGTACVEPLKEDPCKTYRCPFPGQVCLNEGTHAWCACETVCPDVYEPVCGDDRKQYDNKCYLNLASCKMRQTIHEVSCSSLGLTGAKQSKYYSYNSNAPSLSGAILTMVIPLLALVFYR